jgi:L-Ala-D/L-Glu epimerase / N-acetyl-D-glutamate racemase
LHDAFGKFIGTPIVDFYGRQIKTLPTSVTIGIMDVDDTVREAAEFVKLGFKVLKVKTGQSVEVDIERVSKIRERFKKIIIRVDANQGYNPQELQRFITGTETLGLEVIEQPVPVGEEEGLRQIDEANRLLLVADESLKNSSSAIKFASTPQLFGIFNIKLMKCGGLLGAFEIATIAQAANINLFWGCNDESIVSITAALHAAFASANTRYIDLDGSFDLAEDIVSGGFILQDGMMCLGDKAGFGFELDPNYS